MSAGRVIFRAREGHQCQPPRDGFFFSRWDDGDQWQCGICDQVWTRWENYAGGGWA